MGKQRKQCQTLFFCGASKITVDGECSHEIKRRLLLGRKVMTNLHSILKSRDITLPAKVHLVKAMVFPVVMYGCETWTINKAEHGRIDAFKLRCWRRLLRVPWTARKSKQSILKEISPECSLEGLMLKLKLQYFGQLMQRANSLEKILMLGKIEGRRRRGWEDERVGWHEFEQALGNGEGLACFSLCDRRVGHDWSDLAAAAAGYNRFSSAHSCLTFCDPMQHTRLPCPSLAPRACSDSCPSSWWCHPTISSPVTPFSSCLQSFPVSGFFPVSQFFTSGGQSIHLQHQSFQRIFRTDFL